MIKNPTIAFETQGWVYIEVGGEYETLEAAIAAARKSGSRCDHDYTVDYSSGELVEENG